jgi:hypothetical protein
MIVSLEVDGLLAQIEPSILRLFSTSTAAEKAIA